MRDWRIHDGDALAVLGALPAGLARCCVTSPPYWGLRDYGVAAQLGLERTPDEYVAVMVAAFREVRRVLADDGTLWLNLGDSYNAYNGGAGPGSKLSGNQTKARPHLETGYGLRDRGLKPKDMVGIPWRVAFALQADGWFLRSDIIWAKPNPMPESVTDRPTKSHEYLFLLAKSTRYYYDADAIAEPATCPDPRLIDRFVPKSDNGKHAGEPQSAAVRATDKQRGHGRRHAGFNNRWDAMERAEQCSGTRNKRSVWIVATSSFKEAHFATFPTALVEPCVKAGSASGDTVLDPFCGAGTTGLVANRLGRAFVGIELNPAYAAMARRRIVNDAPLFNDDSAAPTRRDTEDEK